MIRPGTQMYTDEYDIYARLRAWGYGPLRWTPIAGQGSEPETLRVEGVAGFLS
jgi:hypothetical protein